MVQIVRTVSEQTQSLANYLPPGRVFKQANINDSNFRNLLTGLAGELITATNYIRDYQNEIIPDETVLFINEWERALGIPDDCFPGTGTIDDRRDHILIKLASLGVQTAQDFIDLAALFGIVVTVRSGTANGLFPMVFPIIFFPTEKAARFTIIVTFTVTAGSRFPLEFPFIFGDAIIPVLECLFIRLKPANADIIFEQV